ncbi:hypothetical protein SMB554_01305 [Sinorhizobium meliloti]|nr:putative transmembrane protein [Sinorhizobium meliloti 2011]ASJ57940.1 hypothetical protein SMB554_01305 [Sinorhizobium meliloti]ATA97670.1 hypothetical protein BWO76_15040 [Sinorhizobium meliloti]ATB03377.1 hypothetical protein BWO90_15110 [Sinorhizobium meliloti]CAC41688.1 Hypothetical transmembrane protein [Sinorhizobium meliloti 1021]
MRPALHGNLPPRLYVGWCLRSGDSGFLFHPSIIAEYPAFTFAVRVGPDRPADRAEIVATVDEILTRSRGETGHMFLVSKIFWLVAQPLSLAFLALVVGVLLMLGRFRRSGGTLSAFGLAVLFVTLFTTAGSYFLQILEDRFPRPTPEPTELACIIVLGGAFENVVMASRGGMELNQAAERFVETLRLAQAYPQARILVSGGDGSLSGIYEGDAHASENFFGTFGIGSDRLIREGESRTTFENARYTRDLLAKNGLERCALVTSAYHMPRSIGLFRANGMEVTPWPTDYRTSGKVRLGFDFTQPSLNAQLATTAAKEWTGLVAYYLLGRTQTLLPR